MKNYKLRHQVQAELITEELIPKYKEMFFKSGGYNEDWFVPPNEFYAVIGWPTVPYLNEHGPYKGEPAIALINIASFENIFELDKSS